MLGVNLKLISDFLPVGPGSRSLGRNAGLGGGVGWARGLPRSSSLGRKKWLAFVS